MRISGTGLKRYFFTGLMMLLPLALTIVVISFIFKLLTGPFVGLIGAFFSRYHIFQKGFLIWNESQITEFVSRILILLLLFFFAVALGALARRVFVKYLINFTDMIFRRIPFISSVYKTMVDVINTVFTSKTNSFQQVVLVPFPSDETYSLGLVTNERVPGLEKTSYANVTAVFVPTTPNPTSGFLMMFNPNDIIYLDMTVEEAFKYLISCGVIHTPFRTIHRKSPSDVESMPIEKVNGYASQDLNLGTVQKNGNNT